MKIVNVDDLSSSLLQFSRLILFYNGSLRVRVRIINIFSIYSLSTASPKYIGKWTAQPSRRENNESPPYFWFYENKQTVYFYEGKSVKIMGDKTVQLSAVGGGTFPNNQLHIKFIRLEGPTTIISDDRWLFSWFRRVEKGLIESLLGSLHLKRFLESDY